MAPHTILLVDDHVVVREGVRRLLSGLPEITFSEAASGRAAMELIRAEPIDMVILELNLAGIGGLELLRRFVRQNEKLRAIVFTMHAEPIYAARAMRLGAKGYVRKIAPADELPAAVRRVSAGESYVERDLASKLAAGAFGNDPLQQLTTREVEILRLLGEGNTIAEIAGMLGVSYKTIANSCSLMKNKLGLDRAADLVRAARDLIEC